MGSRLQPVRTLFTHLSAHRLRARVRAAFRAAALRLDRERPRAALRVWRDNARCDAADLSSRRNAFERASDRRPDTGS